MTTIAKFEANREIPDAFFASGTDEDGRDGSVPYIDCEKMDTTVSGQRSMCKGFVIGSASDAAVTATMRLKMRGSNNRVTMRFLVGEPHEIGSRYLYGGIGTAREVFLLY